MSAPAGRPIGRYLLFDEIAAGGMATVHLGRMLGPVGFSRTVAIKRLHPQLAKDPAFVTMFVDEARLAARVRHPNVIPTLDIVTTDGEVFLVMEYVPGAALSRLLRRSERVPLPIALTILIDLCTGLHAAHEAKTESGEPLHIVHRDVSPQNLLVGVDGISRVLDFGVAKAAIRLRESTGEGAVKGKFAYMAPEQLTGGRVDRRSDVFAAAIVGWEVLTGRRLFKGEPGMVVENVLRGEIAPPSRHVDISPALDELIMTGLARDPARRFATAEEMALALEDIAPGASAREVGRWVESLLGDDLVERATRVEAVERSTGLSPDHEPTRLDVREAASTSPRSSESHPSGSRRHAWMLLLLPLLVVCVVVWQKFRPTSVAEAPPTTSTVAPEPSPPSSAEAPPTSSASPPVSAPTARVPSPRAQPRPTGPPAPADPCKSVPSGCRSPWTIAPDGTRRIKSECTKYLRCVK